MCIFNAYAGGYAGILDYCALSLQVSVDVDRIQ